jgi:hypothetical protein
VYLIHFLARLFGVAAVFDGIAFLVSASAMKPTRFAPSKAARPACNDADTLLS